MDTVTTSRINSLVSSNIFEPQNFEDIKYWGYYYIESRDLDAAVEFSRALEQALASNRAENDDEKRKSRVLEFWMFRLKLFAFVNLTLKEQLDIFKKSIAKILSYELNVRHFVFEYIDRFDSGQVIEEITKNFLNALLNSDAILGSKTESFRPLNFQPLVKNWISQYQLSVNKRGTKISPGTFDVVNFVNTEPATKGLVGVEKEALQELLELYNWLVSPVAYVEEDQVKGQSLPYVSREKFVLPADLPAKSTPTTDLSKELAAKLQQSKPAVPTAKPVNIQDILNKRKAEDGGGSGLMFGGQKEDSKIQNLKSKSETPNSLTLASEKDRDAVQSMDPKSIEIDKKLDELKKRTKR